MKRIGSLAALAAFLMAIPLSHFSIDRAIFRSLGTKDGGEVAEMF